MATSIPPFIERTFLAPTFLAPTARARVQRRGGSSAAGAHPVAKAHHAAHLRESLDQRARRSGRAPRWPDDHLRRRAVRRLRRRAAVPRREHGRPGRPIPLRLRGLILGAAEGRYEARRVWWGGSSAWYGG